MSRQKPVFEVTIQFGISLDPEGARPVCPVTCECKTPDAPAHIVILTGGALERADNSRDRAVALLVERLLSRPRLARELRVDFVLLTIGRYEYRYYDLFYTKDGDTTAPILPSYFVRTEVGAGQSTMDIMGNMARRAIPDYLKSAARIKHEVSLLHFEKKKGSHIRVTFESKIAVHRFMTGEYCGAIYIPKFPEVGKLPKHALVLRSLGKHADEDEAAEPVWKSLEELARVVGDPKQRILLTGSPGSGKEVFAQAIHYGSVRTNPEAYVSRSVAGLKMPELRRSLFGSAGGAGETIKGLLAKAEGGTMFLDEFDKGPDDLYGALLRVLESDAYFPVASIQEQKINDVSWVFAGARFDSKRVPPDLWSRLSARIALKNPVEEPGYPAALFLYFHFVDVVRWVGGIDKLLSGEGYLGRLLLGLPREQVDLEKNALAPQGQVREFAREFEKGCRCRRAKISARAIRQSSLAASRVLREEVIAQGDFLSHGAKWQDVKNRALAEAQRILRLSAGEFQ